MNAAIAEAPIEVHENVWIALADGRRLAARLWMPRDAAARSLPAVVEYMPYRKRDATRPRDEPIHAWFAARGYAALRVDMHGSGDSDGILAQEFQKQEQDDACEIIAWIAAQPWCNGAVALFGKSWGAFAALQAALRRPPALKAIVAVCGGQDRYDESLHFTGGAMLVEQLWWSDAMTLFNMRPPDPEISGEGWRAMWERRLEANEPWLAEWLHHQTRDTFWSHGSAADDPGAIACPVLAVGGWADYISRAVPRLLAALRVPRWGLVGPWGHHYPQDGVPGPAIGFLQECDRFLRYALKGEAGAMDGVPMLRAWMPEERKPGPDHAPEHGRFVAEESWPSPRIAPLALHLGDGRLHSAPPLAAAPRLRHRSPQSLGAAAPEWLSMGMPGEAPRDQREDDGRSLVFDSAPLDARLEILGACELEIDLAIDQPAGTIVARLCDVAPDGMSLRVSLGVLNLTHRHGHDRVVAMIPGRSERVRLRFPEVAHAFKPGHRIRLALSNAYWPVLWPSAAAVTMDVTPGTSRLLLPARPTDAPDAEVFPAPESGPAAQVTVIEPARISRTQARDLATGRVDYVLDADGGYLGPGRRWRIDAVGTTIGHRIRRSFSIHDDDPASARAAIEQKMEFERGDWRIALETSTRLWADARLFHAECAAAASEGGQEVFRRTWRFSVPRDGT
jgi:putative CocE/NonD family hydrolase